MKKLLPILLLTSILLSACSFNWSNKEDLFQKKKYCSELKIAWLEESAIHQKFYSPSRDTCIYYTLEWGSHRLYDALTKEFITWTFSEGDNMESWRNFETELKQLKWE